MLRLLAIATVAIALLGTAHAGQLFNGAGGSGENDPGRIPSSSDSPPCNTCDLDRHEYLPRSEPDTQKEPPAHDAGGAGGGQPGFAE